MNDACMTRRAALLALATLPLADAARAQTAKYAFRFIEVDVSPVLALGDTFTPPLVAKELQVALAKTFAPYLGKSGYVLRARVDHVSLGPLPSRPSFLFHASHDYIDGAGLVIGPGGKVVATYPLMTFLDVDYDANGATEYALGLRAAALADAFARWLPGQMGL